MVKMLTEDLIDGSAGFYEAFYKLFVDSKININEKERYILTSLPAFKLAEYALLAYKSKEAAGYLNAILAFSMENAEFPIDFYNEYSLTLGRAS